jgi:integrase
LLDPTDDMLRPSVEAALRKVEAGKHAKRQRALADGKTMRGWTPRPELREKWITAGIERERLQRPEMFKAFCLALFAGLRRDEIDTLTWKQIDFANHTIRIETNEFTRAKSERSEAAVDIDPTFTERLRQWMQQSGSAFVISAGPDPKTDVSSYHHYRCDAVFKRLTVWLQAHGVEDRSALHTLRKEFGTQINRSYGLFAASAALRHASIQLTRAVYVAKKDRAVFAMPGREVARAAAS